MKTLSLVVITFSIKLVGAAIKFCNTYITICLRGIRNAWHFHYALVLVFKVVCGGICIASLTP
ncbi:TPA: DUF3265 domain-containing protein [Vibrio vulnificus]|nr:DUF3265 domain-containing protein [Vibrio vulnificus]